MKYQGSLTSASGNQGDLLYDVIIHDDKNEGLIVLGYGYMEVGSVWWIHIPANGKAFQVKITSLTRDRSCAEFVILKKEE